MINFSVALINGESYLKSRFKKTHKNESFHCHHWSTFIREYFREFSQKNVSGPNEILRSPVDTIHENNL
jgi:hypothetical protein